MLISCVSAPCPQNMLQQLLIHQPEDPVPFMINYFQQDNDNGEHSAPPPVTHLLGTLRAPILLEPPRGPLLPSSWEHSVVPPSSWEQP